jgi:catechol 2,3-dioxygenase-like lactoylglutathione lyase family enzyme
MMATPGGGRTPGPGRFTEVNIDLVTFVVPDYDEAVEYFTRCLGFDLTEDAPARTNSGRSKRWVVVRPPGAQTGLLLARADGDRQRHAVGNQTGGRVTLFLQVDNFERTYEAMRSAGVAFVKEPRTESYGRVAVFEDPWGNRWDLLGP